LRFSILTTLILHPVLILQQYSTFSSAGSGAHIYQLAVNTDFAAGAPLAASNTHWDLRLDVHIGVVVLQ
jgi:hypothetical protein